MCEVCGCGQHSTRSVAVHENILSENDAEARHNREHFAEQGVFAINLMGSPGSGKTAVLEAVARALGPSHGIVALSGDLATDNDARRLRAAGIEAMSITTGSACHLDARLVHDALHHVKWRAARVLVVENVGNLVCPAVYDLGQAANVVALSVTEGEDKPLKYPVMFRKADLVLLTKVDLMPHLGGYTRDAVVAALGETMPEPRMIDVSATTGEGIAAFVSWIDAQRAAFVSRAIATH
jgi:hydrogenase nickel incorporation protein HypB